MEILPFIKKHPVETGAAVFVGGFVLIYAFKLFGGGGGQQSSDGGLGAAYLAAQSAEAQSGNALQAVQVQTAADTAQAQINARASIANNSVWAGAQQFGDTTGVQVARVNATAAERIAPYQVQSGLIAALGGVASQPGSTVTSSDSTNILGLFGSSETSSAYVPNPAATSASQVLGNLAGHLTSGTPTTGNYPAH